MIKKKHIKKIVLIAAGIIFAIGLNNRLQDSEAVNSSTVEKYVNNNSENVISDAKLLASNENKTSTRFNETNKYSTAKSKPVVVIDAGHGGYDTGAIGSKRSKEKSVTLPVALKLGSILENKGIKVIYTRESDNVSWPSNVKADLRARAEIANKANADFFISIHANSSIFKIARGIETYYTTGNSKSKALAGSIQNQLIKNIKLTNRGIKSDNYYVLKHTKATSVLVELGFITNHQEENILNNSNYQNQYAVSIANGILNYLEK